MLTKLWVDDKRCPPDNTWKWVTTPEAAISYIDTHDVDTVSLDHDLGLPDPRDSYQVLKWIEAQAAFGYWRKVPDVIRIHTRSDIARLKMRMCIEEIDRLMEKL